MNTYAALIVAISPVSQRGNKSGEKRIVDKTALH